MLTVRELQDQRLAVAAVNHETYKGLLHQVQNRLRTRAENKCTDLAWQVPPLVPGRPVYTVSHAARYISDKLRHGGFRVDNLGIAADVHVLHISWDSSGGGSKQPVSREPTPAAAAVPSVADASRSLEKLKARLRLG